jgi:HEAT repeat protein
MKNPIRSSLLGTLIAALTGIMASCSKEDVEAKKVNVSAMTAALKSDDKDARVNACVELAKAGPRSASAVPALIPLLKDKEPEVRKLAAYALGQVGPEAKSALPALKELTADRDRGVTMQAVDSLRSIDPKGFSDLKNTSVTDK